MSDRAIHETAPPDAGIAAEVRGVSVGFGGRNVLRDVSLAVRDGEIVTVIGPNGSGKTTLLRVLLGLVAPSEGDVRLRPGLHVGYMPQTVAIDRTLPLTAERFLTLGKSADREHAAAALAEVGAAHVIDSPVQDISGGEFQRVLLARAILREPGLLVLDEPVQSVDVTGQRELHNLITRIRDRRGCAVLMVSHDLHLVMAATDTVLCLNHHVCCTGRPEAVSRHPAYIELFGPEVARDFAVYTHDHDHAHEVSGEVTPLGDATTGHAREGGEHG